MQEKEENDAAFEQSVGTAELYNSTKSGNNFLTHLKAFFRPTIVRM